MSGIFKNYDIRGRYPNDINDSVFYNIGKVMGELGFREIAIGRDARLSSDTLFSALSKGLMESRVNVIDLGILTSPMLSLFCVTNKVKGAMITASHNPKEYNGLKLISENGQQLGYDRLLKKIEKLIMKSKGLKILKTGKLIHKDTLQSYIRYLKKRFNLGYLGKKRIVIDCSNGTGGIVMKELREKGLTVFLINEKLDGNFPNHDPDQTKPENLRQLQKEVLKIRADIGVMFDGDCDRCTFIDEKGKIVSADIAFLILALSELKTSKIRNPKVLFDLRFSRIVSEVLKSNGAKPVIMKVGNPFYKRVLHKDKKSILGGEYSGHIMYKSNHSIDDAVYATLKFISALSKSKSNLSDIIEKYQKYYKTDQISIKTNNPEKLMRTVYSKYKKEKISGMDGISVEKKNVWFNIRISNTEPVIRFVVEGNTKRDVEIQKKEILRIIS